MKSKAKIGELKTHFSSYIQKVKNGGEVIVTERDTPVAKIIPFSQKKEKLLIIHKPKQPYKFIDIKVLPMDSKIDILEILKQTRADKYSL